MHSENKKNITYIWHSNSCEHSHVKQFKVTQKTTNGLPRNQAKSKYHDQ